MVEKSIQGERVKREGVFSILKKGKQQQQQQQKQVAHYFPKFQVQCK